MGQFCGNARGHQAIASAVLRLAVPEREEVGWNGSFAGNFLARGGIHTCTCANTYFVQLDDYGGEEGG